MGIISLLSLPSGYNEFFFLVIMNYWPYGLPYYIASLVNINTLDNIVALTQKTFYILL